MEYGGTNSLMALDAGYSMYFFDPYNGPEWTPPSPANPVGKRIGEMIADPGYVIPGPPAGAGGQDTLETAGSTCRVAADYLVATANYTTYVPKDAGGLPEMSKIECWRPGDYTTTLSVGNGDLAILYPGLYYLRGGLDSQGSVIGGFKPGEPGVALVFMHEAGTRTRFNTQTSGGGGAVTTAVALNAGSKFKDPAGVEATAALDGSGNPITTGGTPPIKMTVMVTRDPTCLVTDPYPTACVDTGSTNHVVNMTGSSDLYLAGVQFMPSDNATINSSGATGYVGQIWAWTIHYSGGTTLNQEGSSQEGPGKIRIDTACSPGATGTCD
jgi:hypothetical protein